jgi:alpha-L-fucosidase
MLISANNGTTWSQPVDLHPNLGPVRNKPFLSGSGIRINPSSRETDSTWFIIMERSADGGKTYEQKRVPAQQGVKAIQPVILDMGEYWLALCRSNQNVLMQTVSFDDGLTWSQLEPTQVANPNAGIEALHLQSGKYLLVYNPLKSGKEWFNGRNQLSLAISDDASNWQYLGDIENKSAGEFSYPSAIQTPDGFVHITYTYNREAIRYLKLKINR